MGSTSTAAYEFITPVVWVCSIEDEEDEECEKEGPIVLGEKGQALNAPVATA